MPPSRSSSVRNLVEGLRESDNDARRRKGLASAELTPLIVPGAVFILPKKLTQFPDARLPDAGRASEHERRIIVAQSEPVCQDDGISSLLIVPCTAHYRGPVKTCDFPIPSGEPGFTKDPVVAYASLMQPVLKSDLADHKGRLRASTLGQLMAVVARNLGMTAESLGLVGRQNLT